MKLGLSVGLLAVVLTYGAQAAATEPTRGSAPAATDSASSRRDAASDPTGYRAPSATYVRRRRPGLIIAGGVLFGVLYSVSATVAAVSAPLAANDLRWLAVPLVGPIIQSAREEKLTNPDRTAQVLMYADSIGQAAGIAMFVVGLLPRDVLVRDKDVRRDGPRTIMVAPLVDGPSRGLSLVAQF